MSMPVDDNSWDPAPATIFANDRAAENGLIRCDALGCEESHPLDHPNIGDVGFDFGRWLGWIYVDLNRPDLFERQLRFCSIACAVWWLEREVIGRGRRPISPLEVALNSPQDRVKRQAALRYLRENATEGGRP